MGQHKATIRVHYTCPGFTGKISDFVSFRFRLGSVPSDFQKKAISSAAEVHDVLRSEVTIDIVEYREDSRSYDL